MLLAAAFLVLLIWAYSQLSEPLRTYSGIAVLIIPVLVAVACLRDRQVEVDRGSEFHIVDEERNVIIPVTEESFDYWKGAKFHVPIVFGYDYVEFTMPGYNRQKPPASRARTHLNGYRISHVAPEPARLPIREIGLALIGLVSSYCVLVFLGRRLLTKRVLLALDAFQVINEWAARLLVVFMVVAFAIRSGVRIAESYQKCEPVTQPSPEYRHDDDPPSLSWVAIDRRDPTRVQQVTGTDRTAGNWICKRQRRRSMTSAVCSLAKSVLLRQCIAVL